MDIEVKGHSGCKIEIRRENGKVFLYKSTADLKYFSRLKQQAEKQIIASSQEYQHIRVPRIFDISETPSKVEIKMEYIYSNSYNEHFESAGFEKISYFEKGLIHFIEKELQECKVTSVASSSIMDKLGDVERKITQNTKLPSRVFNPILTRMQTIITSIDEFILPIGKCHGDLTFSNILFNGNNFYLIDFLDSFIESPLLDIVKIRQDSRYLWSPLMTAEPVDMTRLHLICRHIDQSIEKHFAKYEWYNKYYAIFQILNFLRIVQYAHEENVIDYLYNTIKEIMYEFYPANSCCC